MLTLGTVEPQLTLEALRRPFVKIVSGLLEDLHKGLPVWLPSRIWTWATIDYLLISSGGVGSLLGGIACRNECSIYCVHAYTFTAGRSVSRVIHMQAGTGQKNGGRSSPVPSAAGQLMR